MPEGDKISISHKQLEGKLASTYGGRLAEELIYGKENISTGASSDIQVASNIARRMVTEWGFSENLGPILYKEEESFGAPKVVSEATAKLIDEEVRKIVDRNYERARKVLEENMDILHAMKDALMKYETIDMPQIKNLMERKPVGEPAGWNESGGDSTPTASSSEEHETDKKSATETTLSDSVADTEADAK